MLLQPKQKVGMLGLGEDTFFPDPSIVIDVPVEPYFVPYYADDFTVASPTFDPSADPYSWPVTVPAVVNNTGIADPYTAAAIALQATENTEAGVAYETSVIPPIRVSGATPPFVSTAGMAGKFAVSAGGALWKYIASTDSNGRQVSTASRVMLQNGRYATLGKNGQIASNANPLGGVNLGGVGIVAGVGLLAVLLSMGK